jgi:hypothetical protein
MRGHAGLTAVAGLAALLLLAPIAQGAYDPVGSGTTKLTLDKRFASFLKQDKVALSAKAPAKRKGATFALPISSGNLDPTTGKGETSQEGTLIFQSAKGKVPLRELTVKTKHSPLIAKVGGSQLKVATASKLSTKRDGFGSTFTAKALALSAKAATRLNKKLRPKVPFQAGQPLGTLLTKAQPQLITVLEANKATLLFDSAFLAKLESRFVSLNPIFPAERAGPSFSFPIAVGGAIAPDGSEGTLRTGGTVELLQLGAGQVFWKELWLDLGARSDSAEVDVEPTPAFPGKLGRVGVFDLGAAPVASDPKARTVSVSGAPLTLQAQSAQTLNEAFAQGQGVFAAGEAVGTLSFVAQGQ